MHKKTYNNICRECGCRLDPGEGSLCDDCKIGFGQIVAGKPVKYVITQDVQEVEDVSVDCLNNNIIHVMDYD